MSLADLPRIDDLVADADDLVTVYGRRATTEALRTAVDTARRRLLAEGGDAPPVAELLAAAAADLAARRPGPPKPVVNASGVVVHTNLGRAPLPPAAVEAMVAASGYCDVEYELDTGDRGSRDARVGPLVAEACGAEAGIAVNNCASALVLVLAALASGQEVLVSRGELVEIGGSFRLPEIMAASGARLVEVGTTNRTRVSDYAGGDPALILKVHPSNYRLTGFTEAPSVDALAEVARRRGIPLVHDVGSGLLEDTSETWLQAEPSMRGSLAAGADLVLCSGDKLLGGPQAGLLAGGTELVATCRRHPLARALRLDKVRIAGLVATLEAHLAGHADDEIPVWQALHGPGEALRNRSAALAAAVGGTVVDGATLAGGGSAPGAEVPTPVVRLDCPGPEVVARRLRTGDPPIVVRVEDDAVWVDLRTVPHSQDGLVTERLRRARDGS